MELATLRERMVDKNKQPPDISITESDEDIYTPAIDLSEGITTLKEMLADHENDLNFPDILLLRMQNTLARAEDLEDEKQQNSSLLEEIRAEIEDIKASVWDDSPYAAVRAVCPPTDDPTLPTLTFRVWIIGLAFTILCIEFLLSVVLVLTRIVDGINSFFKLRLPGNN